jgi:asparagine synthase (glutamine-hydrolysing)
LRDRRLVADKLLDAIAASRDAPAAPYYGEIVWVCMMLEQWLRVHAPAFRLR